MIQEVISEVRITDQGELLLILQSGGKASYQYIYREAAGIYWAPEEQAFKSTPMQDWSAEQWFLHIVKTVSSSSNIELVLSPNPKWSNIPSLEQQAILKNYAT